MDFDQLPRRWLINLHLKLFALNSRNNLLPTLWCIRKVNLHPVVLNSDAQQVTFTISENDITLAFSAIYASTNY
jgi:hypothetical protein